MRQRQFEVVALGLLIGQWAHVVTDMCDTAGVMPFFPFSTEPLTVSMWKHAAVAGRHGDASAYYSSLGGVWDFFWFVMVVVFARKVLRGEYFRSVIIPADPKVWAAFRRWFRLTDRGLLVLYRGYFIYGFARMVSWFLYARFEVKAPWQPVWGAPDWVVANDLSDAGVEAGLHHSRMWHRVMGTIQLGTLPVVSALKGAVIGGGLELASATHIRVAEPSAFYALPEGQRGLFLGGGGSVRLPRLIGVARMTDMMLTGRVYDAAEGHAAGLSHYLVDEGEAFDKALELAGTAAEVAPMTTYAVLQALPRIAEVGPHEGYLLESLMAAVASSSEDAQARMRAFLEGRAARVAAPEAQS